VRGLERFGRERLSKSFFMRDFLYSEIASLNGFDNVPSDPELAIAAGKQLCEQLLEPLQDAFGRIAVRSAYRSPQVNEFGNKHNLSCASNASNAAGHIWDLRDAENCVGATACIVIPSFYDRFGAEGDWKRLAWWIHDHLPYSEMEFFLTYWAFNLSWHERPKRRISNWIETPRTLSEPGMSNNGIGHEQEWRGIL